MREFFYLDGLLALSLLVLGVFANYHDFALALDDFALLAHRLHGRSYFHLFYLLLASPGDSSAGQVIRGHLNRDLIAGEDPDKVHSEFSGDMSQYCVSLTDIYHEHRVGQGFDYRALEFDYVVFCQVNFLLVGFDGCCRQSIFSAIVNISGSPSVMRIVFS